MGRPFSSNSISDDDDDLFPASRYSADPADGAFTADDFAFGAQPAITNPNASQRPANFTRLSPCILPPLRGACRHLSSP